MVLKLRKNAQVTLPKGIRKAVHLEEGDVLECEVRDGQIVLTPKKLVDKRDAWFWSPEWQRAEAEAQEDIEIGKLSEFESIEEVLAHLERE